MSDAPNFKIDATPVAADSKSGPADNELNGLRWYDIEKVATPLLHQVGHDQNASVSKQELGAALTDPHYSGAQAEAISGLYSNFEAISRRSGKDGSSIDTGSIKTLYSTIYDSEKKASNLINMDDWTQANFALIDHGAKGYLLHSDVTTALNNATGADKSNLDVLNKNFSQIDDNGHVTAGDVTHYVDNYLHNDANFKFTDAFEQAIGRSGLAQSGWVAHDLYADSAQPEKSILATDIDQGVPNDCSFNAPLASLAQARPEEIKKMVSKNNDGSLNVNFPGQKVVHIQPPTAAEQGMLDNPTHEGYWPAVLEKAYGQKQIDDSPKLQRSHALPVDVLDKKQSLVGPTELLTGHQAGEIMIASSSKQAMAAVLAEAFGGAEAKVVTLGTGSAETSGTTKDGFMRNHGFSVLGYHGDGQGNGEVLVRDTYGVGGPKKDGFRVISLQQVKDNFTDLVYEK